MSAAIAVTINKNEVKQLRFPLMLVLLAGWLVFPEITLGHGTEIHGEESQAIEKSPAASSASGFDKAIEDHGEESQVVEQSSVASPASRLGKAIEDFTFEDFPTLHPMVVHVPVIMIPVAFIFGLISIFSKNRHFVVFAMAFASIGTLGGLIAAFPMHPHTRGLPEAAVKTLQQHDFFAYSTLGIAAFSVMVGIIALLKPNFLTKGLLATILLLASLCVSLTAHYGGTLTYVHGVGVNGKYLNAH